MLNAPGAWCLMPRTSKIKVLSRKLRFFLTKMDGGFFILGQEKQSGWFPGSVFRKYFLFRDLDTSQGSLNDCEMYHNCSYLAEKLRVMIAVLVTLVGAGLFLLQIAA